MIGGWAGCSMLLMYTLINACNNLSLSLTIATRMVFQRIYQESKVCMAAHNTPMGLIHVQICMYVLNTLQGVGTQNLSGGATASR